MKAYFLALIGGQLFAVDKECVAGVGIRNESKGKLLEEKGRKFLPLPDGNLAAIYDLQPPLGERAALPARQSHYLIVSHQGRFMALVMTGKGRLAMVDETMPSALPPAFSGFPRELVPGVLVNCADLILLLNLDVLAKGSDGAVSGEL